MCGIKYGMIIPNYPRFGLLEGYTPSWDDDEWFTIGFMTFGH